MSFEAKPVAEVGLWDVILIGSGPASLTAAIYTSRGAASTLILAGEKWGGQLMLTTVVDNYPGMPGIMGPELMQKMKDHALSFGASWIEKNVTGVDFKKRPFEVRTDTKTFLTKSVIVATGAETLWLNVPGEQKLIGRGVSSCAPCDAPFFKEKKVAVIGGGDSAMEEALVLSKYALEVTVIHRRDEFRASAIMQEKVFANPKIKVLWNTEVVEVVGETKLEKILLRNNKNGSTSELVVDGVFIAIGHSPSSKIFAGQLELDEKGYIKKFSNSDSGFSMATSVNGVFVAGDVHDYHYRQAITAAGFGCMAALDVLKYLDELRELQKTN